MHCDWQWLPRFSAEQFPITYYSPLAASAVEGIGGRGSTSLKGGTAPSAPIDGGLDKGCYVVLHFLVDILQAISSTERFWWLSGLDH